MSIACVNGLACYDFNSSLCVMEAKDGVEEFDSDCLELDVSVQGCAILSLKVGDLLRRRMFEGVMLNRRWGLLSPGDFYSSRLLSLFAFFALNQRSAWERDSGEPMSNIVTSGAGQGLILFLPQAER